MQNPIAVTLERGPVRTRLLGDIAHRVDRAGRAWIKRRLAAELAAHVDASSEIGNTHGPG